MNDAQKPPQGSQSAELTYYAIGFDFDNDGLICAFCFKNECIESEYPNLLVSVTKTKTTKGSAICPKCGLQYLRGQTEDAAKHIIDNWT